MTEEMTVEDWLAIRKQEGLKIDPSTAEVESLSETEAKAARTSRTSAVRRPGSSTFVEATGSGMSVPQGSCAQ
jgi:hypothetical protein